MSNNFRNAIPLAQFTLLPSKFPREYFDLAMSLQPAVNLLYFRASRDYEFLQNALGEVAKSDFLIREMLQIMHDVKQEGGYERQPISINWARSDYMLHKGDDGQEGIKDGKYELKQIEVNANAAGGATLATRMTRVHRHVLSHLNLDTSLEVLRDNNPNDMIVEAIYMQWLKFGDPSAVVLNIRFVNTAQSLVLNDIERGVERLSGGKIKFENMLLEECDDRLILDPDSFSLRLHDDRQVAIACHRNFPSNQNRVTVEMLRCMRKIERSTAIKLPSMGFHLMNLKKIQQVLAKPGMLERFFPNPDELHYMTGIRKTFAGLWGLDDDDEDTKTAIEDAIAHPDKYVLKPMQEGGGHNIFGVEIAEKLRVMPAEERATHILQQRLQPPTFWNYWVEPLDPFGTSWHPKSKLGEMVTELSSFGTLIGNVHDGTVLYNRAQGYMMRTKRADSDEGGIGIGQGCYDSPYLY